MVVAASQAARLLITNCRRVATLLSCTQLLVGCVARWKRTLPLPDEAATRYHGRMRSILPARTVHHKAR